MIKHPIRVFSCAVLLICSLSYPITSFSALVVKADVGNRQITLQWAPVKGAIKYGVCYARQTITDINNCLNYTGGTWQDITKTTLTISKLINGKKYNFRVIAENTTSVLGLSNVISAIPNKPALNDTGITLCSDGVSNNLPCPVQGYPNQDAQSGRDVSKNNSRNGHAGFDFTKISKAGVALAINSKSWSCVKDNVTGLMWEMKTDDNSLHDKNWTYSWYEPDNSKNGGFAGLQNYGSCGGTSACDTQAYVKAVNVAGWCGYKDWRMPSKTELNSIVDYGHYNPEIASDIHTIFTSFLPIDWFGSTSPVDNSEADWYSIVNPSLYIPIIDPPIISGIGGFIWSSSPVASDRNGAWIHANDIWYASKSDSGYVWLVRGGQ